MTEPFADPSMIIFGKLALATFLGMLIGAERAMAGKRAGTRTVALVALGACLFTIISTYVTNEYLGLVNFDPMRVAAAIITGIGFIGAGLIIFRGDKVHGLTTAAGLWVSAGVGIAVGYGMYAISVFVTVLVLLVFTAVWFLERSYRGLFRKYDRVQLDDDISRADERLDDERPSSF